MPVSGSDIASSNAYSALDKIRQLEAELSVLKIRVDALEWELRWKNQGGFADPNKNFRLYRPKEE